MVRGFDDPDRDSLDSMSPTASRDALRVALFAMSTHGCVPWTVDVRTAFLQVIPLDRPTAVFFQPPKQAQEPTGTVWQLRQCAFELTHSPRRWYDSVFTLMRILKLERSTFDHVLFTTHRKGKLALLVVFHVDYFFISVTAEEIAHFDTALRATFAGGPTTSGDIIFTGLRIRTELDEDTRRIAIRVDQEAFIE